MKEYKRKSSFEKAFKQFVHNFDETKIWFTYRKKEVKICFIENGKLQQFPMYMGEYSIQLDGWRFIEFLETGVFPLTTYVMVYSDEDIDQNDIGKVFEFEYRKGDRWKGFDMFHYNNLNSMEFLSKYRLKYPNCGMKQLPKPRTSTYKNSEF